MHAQTLAATFECTDRKPATAMKELPVTSTSSSRNPLLLAAGLFSLMAMSTPVPASAQGEGVYTPPPTTAYPNFRVPGWNKPVGGSFQVNQGEGGSNAADATPGGLLWIDGHTRQVGEQFRVNNGDNGG